MNFILRLYKPLVRISLAIIVITMGIKTALLLLAFLQAAAAYSPQYTKEIMAWYSQAMSNYNTCLDMCHSARKFLNFPHCVVGTCVHIALGSVEVIDDLLPCAH
jgi:hypothetical protein